jgi:hypothetical protein
MVYWVQSDKVQISKSRCLDFSGEDTPEFREWQLMQPSPNSNNGDLAMENVFAEMIMHSQSIVRKEYWRTKCDSVF